MRRRLREIAPIALAIPADGLYERLKPRWRYIGSLRVFPAKAGELFGDGEQFHDDAMAEYVAAYPICPENLFERAIESLRSRALLPHRANKIDFDEAKELIAFMPDLSVTEIDMINIIDAPMAMLDGFIAHNFEIDVLVSAPTPEEREWKRMIRDDSRKLFAKPGAPLLSTDERRFVDLPDWYRELEQYFPGLYEGHPRDGSTVEIDGTSLSWRTVRRFLSELRQEFTEEL